MKALGRPAWIRVAVAAGALVAVLIGLFVNTRHFDESDYYENVARLRHLKQLDVQSEVDVLRSRTGINPHYDPLAGSLTELTAVLGQFRTATARQSHDESVRLADDGAALSGVLQTKAALIERFKSENAVLRNSLAFLPIAAQEAQQSLSRVGKELPTLSTVAERASATVNRLLLATILYSQSASRNDPAGLQEATLRLDVDALALPSESRDRLAIFSAHARTILREQGAVGAMLAAISAVPTAARIDEIGSLLVAEQQHASARTEQSHRYLLAFSTVLIGLCLYAAVRLRRNHVVITQKNDQLLDYGRGLEGMVAHRVAELRDSEARMTRLAEYDFLTGLPNRKLFRDRLAEAMARADRDGGPMALMFIDLDHFKEINDSLGHVVGDGVLKAVARRLRESMHDADTVARLGGDEFTIILERLTAPAAAILVAARVKQALAEPLLVDAHTFVVSVSIGIAHYASGSNDGDGLLQAADIAMYRAKGDGRNAHAVFVPEMAAQISERANLEMLLRQALDRDEFELHYQPKLELATGRIAGVEALLRWNSKELGSVPPSRFIPLAEKMGLIVSIGEWVLRAACEQGTAWLSQGLPPLTIAVNLSPRELRDPRLVERIAAVLKESGFAAGSLELELTEGVIMDDVKGNVETLTAIRTLGVSLAIDDFGTGYSSLAYLSRLPIQTLKIDRAFIVAMLNDTNARTLVATMVTLAHSLNLTVVAEGVETPQQQDALRSLACDQIQGYGFSGSLPADALALMLRANAPSKTVKPLLALERNLATAIGWT